MLIYDEPVDSADEFLQALSPRGGLIRAAGRHQYLFRGQTSHRLLPKALRKNALFLEGRSTPHTNRQQIAAEYRLARRFYLEVDSAGLPIPGDTQ